MSFWNLIYTILISPIELLFEVIFNFSNSIINNPVFSIIILSLVVNFLVLPLYIRADAIQEEERRTEEKLDKWVKHIRKTFKGDERFMMLQMYYNLNDYKPTYVLKSSLPLLLQVPFFIAAYNYLSHLSLLKGFSYGPISDFGAPDAMITIMGIPVNVLPVLMTLINIISGIIYTKDSSIKVKIQLYGMALIFLAFLYKSPAGLVFYWTLNNIFSLLKNLFYKLKNPGKTLKVISSITGLLMCGYTLSIDISLRLKVLLLLMAAMLQIPIIYLFLPKYKKKIADKGKDTLIYILCVTIITLLIGVLIPSSVIASSTSEFINIVALNNPLDYMIHCMSLSVGFFIVWLSIFYALATSEKKRVFSVCLWIVNLVFIVDYMFFGTNLGVLSNTLKYDVKPSHTLSEYAINSCVIMLVVIGGYLIWRFLPKAVAVVLISSGLVISGMSIHNIVTVSKEYETTVYKASAAREDPIITLSKKGQNVIVIMMDRMIGRFIPFMMEEDPELYSQFDGFTYYANTISFGPKTNAGSPGVYGGYEYIPEKMNERDTELLADKHDEALKVMPVVFDEAGMDVTVFDPTYAGYGVVPDLSIYDDHPNIKKYITMGNASIMEKGSDRTSIERTLNRNFFCYGVFKVAPLILQSTLYDDGNYNSTQEWVDDTKKDEIDMSGQSTIWLSQSHGITEHFMEAYSVLDKMPDITRINDDDKGCFLMMSNDTTHEPVMLKEPEYIPANDVDNREYDETHFIKYDKDGNVINLDDKTCTHEINLEKVKHYQINMCAIKKLGELFVYMRNNDVYDNTKIIIVSDHSTNTKIDDKYNIYGKDENGEDKIYDCEQFTCTLMVKDYNSKGFTQNYDFMTNADVPTLAFKDIIKDPVNPFTGNKIDNTYKYENDGANVIFMTHFHTTENNGYKFRPEAWFFVHDNVHNKSNWKYLGYY